MSDTFKGYQYKVIKYAIETFIDNVVAQSLLSLHGMPQLIMFGIRQNDKS